MRKKKITTEFIAKPLSIPENKLKLIETSNCGSPKNELKSRKKKIMNWTLLIRSPKFIQFIKNGFSSFKP